MKAYYNDKKCGDYQMQDFGDKPKNCRYGHEYIILPASQKKVDDFVKKEQEKRLEFPDWTDYRG